jgi:hypothetical protein
VTASVLPRIPEHLQLIDPILRRDHSLLSAADRCYYLWEYTPRQDARATAGNQLIRNLKIQPSALQRLPSRLRFKHRAIAHAARALRRLVPRQWPADSVSFVPMPCSKICGAGDHDDRVVKVLRRAFKARGADIRELLIMNRSMTADHMSGRRATCGQLRAVLQVRDDAGPALRRTVVIVDDVLNSGKHFKVAQQLLAARYGVTDIKGLFLARCIRAR